jgi:hypothetical protein
MTQQRILDRLKEIPLELKTAKPYEARTLRREAQRLWRELKHKQA